MTLPRKPRVRIGCTTKPFPHSDREWTQYCASCPLMEENLTKEAFKSKCESIRYETNAESVWNFIRAEIPTNLGTESREFLDKINGIDATDDIEEYARKLNDLTEKKIPEEEAFELVKAGGGKMVCDTKGDDS